MTDTFCGGIAELTSSKKLVARWTCLNCFPPPILDLWYIKKIIYIYIYMRVYISQPTGSVAVGLFLALPLSDWGNRWSWWCVCKTAQKLWGIWVCFCSWSPRSTSQTSPSSLRPIQTYPAGTRRCSPSRWRRLWLLSVIKESEYLNWTRYQRKDRCRWLTGQC